MNNPPPVITQFANPDPNAAPLNVTQLVQLLNSLVSSAIQGSYIPYIIQTDPPGAQDHDKAWFKLDSNGKPVGVFIWYSGHWRRVYNGMPGEIRGYTGNPGTDFDSDGKGIIEGNYDGWHLCNGRDGTPNLTDKFLVGAHMDDSGGHSGYASGHWQTFVDGMSDLQTGGVASNTLTTSDTYQPAIASVRARRWDANGQTPNPHVGSLWGIKSATDSENDDIAPAVTGNTSPSPFTNLPPFYALAWIIFIGY